MVGRFRTCVASRGRSRPAPQRKIAECRTEQVGVGGTGECQEQPTRKRNEGELPFFVLSPVCGSVTGSNRAWSVSGPPNLSSLSPRVSPRVPGSRGETEAVVAGEGGGVCASAALRVPGRPGAGCGEAPLRPLQPVLYSASPGIPLA
ncbi:hypothetical protein H8959_008362 [Pygathrix nigripes]